MRNPRKPPDQCGAELKAARKRAGLTQAALGAKARISRQAVSYWECRKTIDPRGWAVQRMAEVEPQIGALLQAWCTNTHAREMGLRLKAMFPLSRGRTGRQGRAGPPSALDALLEAAITHELIRMKEREAQRRARLRVTCGAKTTRKGTACRNKSEPGRKRCKFHGGRSTGPKTAEGRERIAEAQRKRWARRLVNVRDGSP